MSTDRLSIEDKEAMTRDQFLAWFRRMRAPQQAMFWQRLRDAMAQGFARADDRPGPLTVEAPYVPALLARRPDIDRSLLAIAGAGIAVHRDPGGRSPVIDRLDHDVVYQGPALPEATRPGEYRRRVPTGGRSRRPAAAWVGCCRSTHSRPPTRGSCFGKSTVSGSLPVTSQGTERCHAVCCAGGRRRFHQRVVHVPVNGQLTHVYIELKPRSNLQQ